MSQWTRHTLLCLLLGALTSVLIAWTLAATATFKETADPSARAVIPVTYTMYSVRRWGSEPPPTREQMSGYRDDLPVSITNESIREAHAYFGGLKTIDDNTFPPFLQDRRFFSHRQFRSRAATREVLDRFHFDAGQSWEFFSTKPAMLASPDTMVMFKKCFPLPTWPPAFGNEVVIVDRYGWPFAAFGGTLRITTTALNGPPTTTAQWAIPLQWRTGLTEPHGAARMLPMRPLPGVLADTAFFGGVWAVALCIPGMVRRIVRRKRCLCIACGYDLRATPTDLPCPECGKLSAR